MSDQKPYPAYKDSGAGWLGRVPAEWDIVPAKAVFNERREKSTIEDIHLTPSQKFGVLPQAEYMEITGNKVVLNLTGADSMRHVGSGDFISHLRSFQGGLEYSRFDGKVSAAYTVIRPRTDVSHGYFKYLFKSSAYIQALQTTTDQHRDGQSIRFAQLSLLPLPLPPLEEQYAIAVLLDHETARLDEFVATLERLIALLGERRVATISQAVTNGLSLDVPMKDSGVEWLGAVPAQWNRRPLWSMFERIKDVGHPEETMLSVFRDHGVVIKDEHENLNKTAENRNIYQLLHPGWLVTNRMKAWQGSVGISTYSGIVSGHYLCFKPQHSELPAYLNLLFRSVAYTAGYSTLSRGVRIGQAEIDNDHYRLLPVLLPPVHEQREIVDYLENETAEIDSAVGTARKAIALAKEKRAALISAAVTGKIDVSSYGTEALAA